MVKVGDIVAVKNWRGLWVVRERDKGALPKRRWHVSRDDQAHDAGEGDLTVVATPSISEGDWVKYRGRDARVIAAADDTIRVTYDDRSEVAGGGFIRFTECEADVPRATLVLENLHAFL